MAARKLAKWQIASLAIIILIIPVIIVFQLTKADIIINFDDDDPFFNKCFFGQPVCVYDKPIGFAFSVAPIGEITFQELPDEWRVLGEDVFCFKIDKNNRGEPVTDPVGVITERDSNVVCNNIATFEKNEWDLKIDLLVPDAEGNLVDLFPQFSSISLPENSINRFTFTMKGI